MKYGADTNIYRIEQDCDTKEVVFFAYGREEKREPGKRIYSPEEMFDMLCVFSREYQDRRND